jgi:hypothetical protein
MWSREATTRVTMGSSQAMWFALFVLEPKSSTTHNHCLPNIVVFSTSGTLYSSLALRVVNPLRNLASPRSAHPETSPTSSRAPRSLDSSLLSPSAPRPDDCIADSAIANNHHPLRPPGLVTTASTGSSSIDERYPSKKLFIGDRDQAVGVFTAPQDDPDIITCRN